VVAGLLAIAITVQVTWGEARFLHVTLKSLGAPRASDRLRSPGAGLAQAHVPAGRPILYVTEGHGIPELFSYYELSYEMTPRNTVWWAADGPPTTVVDWWLDASGGTPRLLRLATAKGATYLVFVGRPPPRDLPAAQIWTQDAAHTLIQLKEETPSPARGRGT
jgi:hypothetical protein